MVTYGEAWYFKLIKNHQGKGIRIPISLVRAQFSSSELTGSFMGKKGKG